MSLAGPSDYTRLAASPESFLHPEELDYLRSLVVEKRRRDFTLGRYAAKTALARLDPSLAGPAVHVRPGVFQQPVVTPSGAWALSVCITHSGPVSSALAFPAGHPLGIDLEAVRPGLIDTMKTQVTADELPRPGSPVSEAERYARVWTVKEALSKVLHCGLTAPFELLRLADGAETRNGVFTGGFKNFIQYGFLSLATPHMAFAVVHPARTRVSFDRDGLLAFLQACGDPIE